MVEEDGTFGGSYSAREEEAAAATAGDERDFAIFKNESYAVRDARCVTL